MNNCEDVSGKLIKLPENLESVPKADHFPTQRHRWNTNEEIAAILICFEKHVDWLSKEVKIRPKSGSMLLYSRKKVRYRRDGYCWKKRKDGKTTREDHMKLKVQGTECIYGCYVHSAILPTFHRRCYWLLQNPDIVLVHYLNVPYSDDNKLVIAPSLSFCGDKKEWTKEELISQLKPMFFSENEPDLNNELEISTAETVEAIVQQLMEKQRVRNQVKTHECPCDNQGAKNSIQCDSKKCNHTLHRIISPKTGEAGAVGQHQHHHPSTAGSATGATTTHRVAPRKTAATFSTITAGSKPCRSTITVDTTTTTTRVSPSQASAPPALSTPKSTDSPTTPSTPAAAGSVPPASAAPLILNLSQLQGGGGLLILNSSPTPASLTPLTLASFVCNQGAVSATHVTSTARGGSANGGTGADVELVSSSADGSLKRESDDESKLERTTAMDASTYESMLTSDDSNKLDRTLLSASTRTNSPPFGDEMKTKTETIHLFDNETLDLSQEDIQKTLSANLPTCSTGRLGGHKVNESHHQQHHNHHHNQYEMDATDLNPMDFIDNDVSTPDEDVFVNLDAFDMLTDFSDLDPVNPELSAASSALSCSAGASSVGSSGGGSKAASSHNGSTSRMDYREGTANITDFSPDWSYPEGGVKVLVTGPWYSSSSPYNILFDGVAMPTTLVQSGVLRCFCPAHEAGLVTLQVACEGFVISNSVIFEYKTREKSHSDKADVWLVVDENLFKFTLMERLEQIESKLSSSDGKKKDVGDNGHGRQRSFEERLVDLCQQMASRPWVKTEDTSLTSCDDRGLTLLHLAAALGYMRLVCALLHWRADNSSLLLESEVDALSRDHNNCTPLMWACAFGHKDVALLLYQWNQTALNVRDGEGRNPVDVARLRGHDELAQEIEVLEQTRFKENSDSALQTQTDEFVVGTTSVSDHRSKKTIGKRKN
uniref:CG-1 domain-containing protein n=1 Tax=Strigamia maritima TaxID=126957 RepID=T1IL77_STRMM